MRKVIQICVSSGSSTDDSVLFALCNDNSVWQIDMLGKDWHLAPPIPQDQYKAPEVEHNYPLSQENQNKVEAYLRTKNDPYGYNK